MATAIVSFNYNLSSLIYRVRKHAINCTHRICFFVIPQRMVCVLYTINLHLKHPGHFRSAALPFRGH